MKSIIAILVLVAILFSANGFRIRGGSAGRTKECEWECLGDVLNIFTKYDNTCFNNCMNRK